MRIVSLLPAATEICFALGVGNDLVGVTQECDYPRAARSRPVVSRALLDYTGKTSAQASEMVGRRLEQGGALYEVDEGALRRLEPNLILTQGLCDVCAPSVGDVRDAASRLPKMPEILSLDPHHLEDVFEDIIRIGEACGVVDRAATVAEALRARVERVRSVTAHVRDRPRVLCLEWLGPLFPGGHWVPEMVEAAGGEDALWKPGEKSRQVSPKDVLLSSPDVAVLMPCGWDLERAAKEAPTVTNAPWWKDLPAARHSRVWIANGSAYFNRPGPRLADGVEALAHILHSKTFPRLPAPDAARPWMG